MKKVLCTVAILVSAVSFSMAQGFQQRSPEERLKQSLATLEPLKLSADQLAKVTAVYTAQAKTQDSIFAGMQGGGGGGDMTEMRTKMTAMREDVNKKINAVLTEDQKKAYAEILKNQPQRNFGGGGGQGGPPPGQ